MIKQFFFTYRWDPSGYHDYGQSGPRCNDDEMITHITQSSQSEASPSDGLVSYSGHTLKEGCTPVPRCSRRIQQPQSTGMFLIGFNSKIFFPILNLFQIRKKNSKTNTKQI